MEQRNEKNLNNMSVWCWCTEHYAGNFIMQNSGFDLLFLKCFGYNKMMQNRNLIYEVTSYIMIICPDGLNKAMPSYIMKLIYPIDLICEVTK